MISLIFIERQRRIGKTTFGLKNTSLLTLFFLLFPCLILGIQAQTLQFGHIQINGISDKELAQQMSRDLRSAEDSLALQAALLPWYDKVAKQGLLEFSLDKAIKSEDNWQLFFHQGPIYLYESIALKGLNDLYLTKSGIDKLIRKQLPVDWADLMQRLTYCIQLFQAEGYPFAAFQEAAITYRQAGKDTLWTRIAYEFEAGSLVVIDSIHISGNHREKDAFVHSLARLSPGMRYNQALIDDIPRILNNSIYYQKVAPPSLSFDSPEQAELSLKLTSKQAGKFDALLGILPPDANNEKLQFTGTADIVLVSPFRFGEVIQFKYDKFNSNSQRLDLNVMIPYILHTPLKLEASLLLHKQAEDFLNRYFQLASYYNFSPNFAAKFYLKNKRASFLGGSNPSVDSTFLANQLDGQLSMLGLGLAYEQLDYRITPTKGLSLSLDLALGQRALRDNPRIPEELYEGISDEQAVRELDFRIKWYRPISQRHVVHLANHTYWLDQNTYFTNDLLQVGGAKSIRGFNEKQFFTNFYSFFTLEYRLMLEKDSYIFIFGDYAYLQNSVSQENLRARAFGLGMRYGTKAGIISISYAVGSLGTGDLQAGRGKIHIGLINQF